MSLEKLEALNAKINKNMPVKDGYTAFITVQVNAVSGAEHIERGVSGFVSRANNIKVDDDWENPALVTCTTGSGRIQISFMVPSGCYAAVGVAKPGPDTKVNGSVVVIKAGSDLLFP